MITFNQLNFSVLDTVFLIISALIGFITTYLLMPIIIKFMKRKGFVGKDIHKNSQPEVAESGGTGMVFGFLISSILLLVFFSEIINEIIVIIFTVAISGIIGFLDDRIRLRSRYKILLTLTLGLIIFFANYFGFINIENPTLPIIGQIRLNVIYPILLPLIVTVFANTVNMLEGYNGEGSGTCLIAAFFLIICSLIWNSAEGFIFSVITFSVILPFFLYNRFPAKVFPGDVGTLAMGSMLACIAIFGALEAAVFCALLVHVFNSFYYIVSAKGFFESQEIHELRDDIILLEDDKIKASEEETALLTIPRLILVESPLTEKKLVKNFYVLSFISGIFSIITTLLMRWTIKELDFYFIILFSIMFFIPAIILVYYFPHTRMIAIHMVLLYLVGIILLIIIDIYIIPIPLPDLNLIFLKIPFNIIFSIILIIPGLSLWYLITIRYLRKKIKRSK